jgi:hypothetical protein
MILAATNQNRSFRPDDRPSSQSSVGGVAFRVAETTFNLCSADVPMELDPGLSDFATRPGAGATEVAVRWADKIADPAAAPLFDSGALWSVFEVKGGYQFRFVTPAVGPAAYKMAWFDKEFSSGEVELFRPRFDPAVPTYPLEYPLDELLMIHRLSRGEGVEMHAVGLVDEAGRGHLFVGHSGAGKSTTARLWQKESNALILSDDRIILRERDGRIWMHGTPWHGDAGIASPKSAPLHCAYLIEHGSKTELAGVSKGRAAAEFLARSFVPHYSAHAMAFTLEFLDRVARQTPCFAFKFLPDQSAVEAICRASD